MGLDQPSGGKQPLPQFSANPEHIDGQSYVEGPGFHYRAPHNIGEDLISLGQAVGSIAANLKRQKEENQNRQRAVDSVRLQTETQLDLTQAYEQYKNSYNGPDDQFSTGWMETANKYIQAKRTGIKDERLLQAYDEFQMPYLAKNQIQAMTDENQRYTQTFKTNLDNVKQNFDDLLARDPSVSTLNQVVNSLDTVYKPIEERLKAAGQDQAARDELVKEKEKYTVSMFQYMAKQDPDAALATLNDPDANQYIQDPDTRHTLETYIENIKNHQVDGLRQEFLPTMKAYQEALVLGKDTSGLEGKLQMYNNISGVVRPEELRQINIAQQMSGPYADLRKQSVNMSDAEFEDALALMRDHASHTVDEDLPFRMEFHEKAVAALRNDRITQKRNPISTMADITGAGDGPTARMQYIAARLSAGESIDRISVMDQSESERLTNAMHNAVAGNRIGDIVNIWQEMKQSLSTDSVPADKPLVGGTSMMDMALAQMARSTQDPLSKNVVAALSLLPSGQDPSADNVLLKAAFMAPAEQSAMLKTVSTDPSSTYTMDKLEAEIASKVPEWNLYFQPSITRSVSDSELMQAQRNLVLRTALMNMAVGKFGPSGGLFGTPLGATSGRDNAIKSTIQGFLPFQAMDVSGSGINSAKVRINQSQLLVPMQYQDTVTPDKTKEFISEYLNRDSFWHDLSLSGTKPDTTTAVNEANVPKQVSQWIPLIKQAAERFQVPAWLVAAVMHHESGGNPNAMGSSQDSGLMQIIPSTFNGIRGKHQDIGPNVMDPATNIMAGAAYLGDLYRAYRGDLTKILRNYNGGPGTVYSPNAKVLNYVPSVMANVKKFQPTEAAKPTPANTALLEYAKKHVMDSLSLDNTDDFSGVRLMVNYQGRKVPLPGPNGRPVEIPYQQISNFQIKRNPESIPSSFIFR